MERSWLFEGVKPFPVLDLTTVPAGSLVSSTILSLGYWVSAGSVMQIGTDLHIPTFNCELAVFQNRRYTVIGSDWSTNVDLAALDWFMVLPEGAKIAFGSNIRPYNTSILTYAQNAITAELLLGQRRAFGVRFGTSDDEWRLWIRNLVNFLAVEIYKGNKLYWSNQVILDSQGYNTSLYYTPFRFTMIVANRSGAFYGSVVSGSATHYFSRQSAILLSGITANPILITVPEHLVFSISSCWLMHDPYFTRIGTVGEGDCWLRLWLHVLTNTSIYFVPPREGWDWMRQDSIVYGANMTRSSGTLWLTWSETVQPIIGRLVCGTVIYAGGTFISMSAPVKHISYTAELTNDAISSSGQIELLPFKLTDWTTYSWTGIPLLNYRLRLYHRGQPLGTLFVGARIGISARSEQNAMNVTIETADNQALLRRYSIDAPVVYDYWSSEDAARNLLARFGLRFERHRDAPNLPLLPEWYSEKSIIAAWVPRLGETVLDFFNRIAQLNGWRVDWTVYGTVVAYPKWNPIGTVWQAYWPTPDQALLIADILVRRLNVSISDYERRNILIIFGVDAWTQFDVIKVFADLESFLIPWSDRYLPFAVPAFIRFDKPVPSEWMDYLGQQITSRLFVTPFEIEFVMPLSLKVKPGHSIVFQNPNPMNFHRYEFIITRVRHEIGREYSTIINAIAFKQRE
jgi:hypothetical protein